MSHRHSFLLACLAGLLSVQSFAAPVINEIMYRPGTGYPENTGLEFIEIHNPDSEAVDLSDWAITTGADYVFPSGTILPAGGYLVVASDPTALQSAAGIGGVLGPWESGDLLANNGETVTLSEPDDGDWTVVDEVDYANEGDWATRIRDDIGGWSWESNADGGGKSLERRNPLLASTNGQNWGSSTATGGSPGAANSLFSDDIAPVITKVKHFPAVPTSSDPVMISCQVTDESAVGTLNVKLYWRIATTSSPGAFQSAVMTADNAGGFSTELAPLANKQIVEFYVTATDDTDTRTWPAPSSEGQNTNCAYQVDNEVVAGSTPFYRFVLTAAENSAYETLANSLTSVSGPGGGPPGGGGPGGPGNSDPTEERRFNLTLIATRGADTTIRYLSSMRIRGNSSRSYAIKPLRVNVPSDNRWDGVSSFLIGTRGAPWQYLAHKMQRAIGLVAADSSPIELRRQGVEYAITTSSTADFGQLARIEDINGDYVDNHWPDAETKQVYRKVSATSWAYSSTVPSTPDTEWSGWTKQNKKSANDWSDVMEFTDTWQTVCAPHFTGATTGNVASGTWDGTGFTDTEMATLATITDLDYLARWLAIMTIMPNNEPNLSTGEDDDFAAAFITNDGITKMFLIPHDMDTTFGQGEEAWGPTVVGLYDVTETDTIRRLGTGAVTMMEPLLPLLGDSSTPGNAEFREKYLTEIRELFGSVFDADTSSNPKPAFHQYIDNHLGDWVPDATRTTVKNYMEQRQAYLLGLIGQDKIAPTDGTSSSTRNADATPALRINEILASNTATYQNGSAFPDIIELHNAGSNAIDLDGKRLGDFTDPKAYTFPAGTSIAAGGYLVVYADSDTSAPGLHTEFALDSEGDGVYLYDTKASGGALLDGIEFGFQIADGSISRTESLPGVWALTEPTIGTANGNASSLGSIDSVKINEWSGRIQVRTDKDFIELYNPSSTPVALGDARITDDLLTRPSRYDFRKLSYIGAGAHLVLDTDKLEYGLDGDFDHLFFTGKNGAIIDQADFTSQPEDFSTGRSPDGATGWINFAVPTPGLANDTELPAAYAALLDGLRVTEIMYKPTAPSDAGDYEFIELQNVGNTTLDLSGVRFTNGIDYTFAVGTTLESNAYIVICRNRTAFLSRYPSSAALLAEGSYSGALDNSGETMALTLPAPWDVHALKFRYEPTWSPSTAGEGYSLVTVDPATSAARDWNKQRTWTASADINGNPGGLVETVPVISSPTEASATMGTPFSYPITATASPTSFGAADLPAGLNVNTADGLISGTPVQNGTFSVVISATNDSGTGSGQLTLSVAKTPAEVTITDATHTYDGTPKAVTVSTDPAELSTVVTYEGGTTVPTEAGMYAVVATIVEEDFAGLADATLEIVPTVALEGSDTVSATAGGTTALSVNVEGGADVSVQWQVWRSGEWVDYGDPTGSSLNLPSVQLFDTGLYRGVASAGGTEVISETFTLAVDPSETSDARLMNLSTRALSLTNDNVLIPGFVIEGSASKQLLIRAVGPRLEDFGVSGTLPDPQIVLKRQENTDWVDVASNNNWGENANKDEIIATSSQVGAFSLVDDSLDAALLVDLGPGTYSVVNTDTNGATGVAIVELYDVDESTDGSQLANLSNRGFVGTGGDVMIPGFVVSAEGAKTFLLRAVGPTLGDFGVTGVLADPCLTVYRKVDGIDEVILRNDNWGENDDEENIATIAAQIGAFALTADSLDAAFVITLQPGVYTVQASGTGDTTGVALVELYVVE